jgi:hypothetical protein
MTARASASAGLSGASGGASQALTAVSIATPRAMATTPDR